MTAKREFTYSRSAIFRKSRLMWFIVAAGFLLLQLLAYYRDDALNSPGAVFCLALLIGCVGFVAYNLILNGGVEVLRVDREAVTVSRNGKVHKRILWKEVSSVRVQEFDKRYLGIGKRRRYLQIRGDGKTISFTYLMGDFRQLRNYVFHKVPASKIKRNRKYFGFNSYTR